jgi:hypothetical protein
MITTIGPATEWSSVRRFRRIDSIRSSIAIMAMRILPIRSSIRRILRICSSVLRILRAVLMVRTPAEEIAADSVTAIIRNAAIRISTPLLVPWRPWRSCVEIKSVFFCSISVNTPRVSGVT